MDETKKFITEVKTRIEALRKFKAPGFQEEKAKLEEDLVHLYRAQKIFREEAFAV